MADHAGGTPEAVAYNRGHDTRIAGYSRSHNPYFSQTNRECYRLWREGWLAADREWAIDARPERDVKPLPAIYRSKYLLVR